MPETDRDRLRRLRRRAARIERREREAAISALESRGTLTAEQRETVRALAASLVDELIAGPTAALAESGRRNRETGRTVGMLLELETA
ncbi:hypothetical protein [Halorubrum halodurans]|uniref:Tetrapyrrole biosynthesis glutamyl-tRNA reductase dimerisation domain-containing protein n=1 Tax=Halorubrum halodurans TaxID=1383851 RepID=A0A256IC48_9EURY|nr:hypothetical protein [Halorubrum halodurans]OYR54118.1 hypothetical protein DJ70_14855 [Halorubrum halodurans]